MFVVSSLAGKQAEVRPTSKKNKQNKYAWQYYIIFDEDAFLCLPTNSP